MWHSPGRGDCGGPLRRRRSRQDCSSSAASGRKTNKIYGGITYTDLPITNIGYPNTGFQSGGKGVLLGAYIWGLNAMEFTAMTPQERVQKVVDYGSQIHPQYHQGIRQRRGRRMASRALHHGLLWHVDLRHARQTLRRPVPDRRAHRARGRARFFLGGWQEGAVTSALDAIERLHQRAVAQGNRA